MNRRVAPFAALLAACTFCVAEAQNVVDGDGEGRTAPPIALGEAQVRDLLDRAADLSSRPSGAGADRVRGKLDRHVAELVGAFPLAPFHNTLGISGYETYFGHPDELFHVLSIALPQLSEATAEKTRKLLAELIESSPPYAVAGFDAADGSPRESYDVPAQCRAIGVAKAKHAFGVYAFWEYCRYAGRPDLPARHWDQIVARMKPLLESDYPFDVARRDYTNDEAERLGGDMAGLVGLVRLARTVGDAPTERQAAAAAQRLFELRVNLERVNPQIYEKTNSSTAHLHIGKLTRYCSLVPEVGRAVTLYGDGLGAVHLDAFRRPRNAWYLAFGERMIGGENYTNPPHFARSLFAGAALAENRPADVLRSWIDVPWCRGDLYFIEKCVFALWADAGRPWTQADSGP